MKPRTYGIMIPEERKIVESEVRADIIRWPDEKQGYFTFYRVYEDGTRTYTYSDSYRPTQLEQIHYQKMMKRVIKEDPFVTRG